MPLMNFINSRTILILTRNPLIVHIFTTTKLFLTMKVYVGLKDVFLYGSNLLVED